MTASEMFDKAGELWKVWLNLFWCTLERGVQSLKAPEHYNVAHLIETGH